MEIRKILKGGLGISPAFVDDGVRTAVVLAREAVKAGLHESVMPKGDYPKVTNLRKTLEGACSEKER